jgi:hypothetical protein
MRCARCNGLMVWDRFLDMGQADILWAFAWRCINCGEVLDAVIHDHRRALPTLAVTGTRALRAKISDLPQKPRRAFATPRVQRNCKGCDVP